MDAELSRRALDLARRAEKYAAPANTGFLTPAEQAELRAFCARERLDAVFHGGGDENDRRAAFFLPSWMEEDALDVSEAIAALEITAAFGAPGHRDYLGAILGLGIKRDCLGDIRVAGSTAYLFCLASIAPYLCANLESVGRCGVKIRQIALSDVPPLQRSCREVRFTVKSLRLDSVLAGAFALSRANAAAAVAQGLVSVNYLPCEKPDRAVAPGDVLSLRGKGKVTVGEPGGKTRKDQQASDDARAVPEGERAEHCAVMRAEETELPVLIFKFPFELPDQGSRDVHSHQRRTMLDLQAGGHEFPQLRPILIRQLMAKGSPDGIGLLIVLQDQRIRHLMGRFDRACNIGLLIGFHRVAKAIGQQIAVLAAPVGFAVLHVNGVHDQLDHVPVLFREAVKARFAALCRHLSDGVIGIGFVVKVQHRLHDILGAVGIAGVLHCDIRRRQQARGKIVGSGDAALLRAGIEAHFTLGGNVVFRDKALPVQPFPEILSHAGLLDAARQGQFAGSRRPIDPRMGR